MAFFSLRLRLRLAWLRFRFRRIDPLLCCCGSNIGQGGDICRHGGCRSAKEHAVSTALDYARGADPYEPEDQ